jgi:hypothetical protein
LSSLLIELSLLRSLVCPSLVLLASAMLSSFGVFLRVISLVPSMTVKTLSFTPEL